MLSVHIIEDKLYCKAHCPKCSPVSLDWIGEPTTLTGEQQSLF